MDRQTGTTAPRFICLQIIALIRLAPKSNRVSLAMTGSLFQTVRLVANLIVQYPDSRVRHRLNSGLPPAHEKHEICRGWPLLPRTDDKVCLAGSLLSTQAGRHVDLRLTSGILSGATVQPRSHRNQESGCLEDNDQKAIHRGDINNVGMFTPPGSVAAFDRGIVMYIIGDGYRPVSQLSRAEENPRLALQLSNLALLPGRVGTLQGFV